MRGGRGHPLLCRMRRNSAVLPRVPLLSAQGDGWVHPGGGPARPGRDQIGDQQRHRDGEQHEQEVEGRAGGHPGLGGEGGPGQAAGDDPGRDADEQRGGGKRRRLPGDRALQLCC